MSEFGQAHQVARLIGSPPGYVGHGEGGELSEGIRRKPNSVVLLDEIDKAHPKAWDLLLQVFDEGRLTDSDGRHVDCRSCLFVMTSNFLARDRQPFEESEARASLGEVLRPELVNRIQNVIRFEDLGAPELKRVVEHQLASLNGQLEERGVVVELTDASVGRLVEQGLEEGMGARSVQRLFDRQVRDAIVDELFLEQAEGGTFVLDLGEGERAVLRRAA